MLASAYDLVIRFVLVRIWRLYIWLFSFPLSLSHGPPAVLLAEEQKRRTLTSLPTEVVSQILTYLDCSSILAFRQTCRIVHSTTKSRQVWYHHIARLQIKHGVFPPEEGRDEYTISELEQWVLRRDQVQDIWRGSRQPRFRSRVVDPRPSKPYPKPSYRKIVPGGRWLLMSYPSAVMYVVDLDATNPAPRILYDPTEFDQGLQNIDIDYTIWVDQSKPRLSFHLAGCVREEESSDDTRTFVYQVELIDHGASATLAARPHALFRDFRPGWKHPRFALNDRYVVEVWDDPDPEDSMDFNMDKEIKVYHYRQALVAMGHPEYCSIKPIVRQLRGSLCTLVEFVHKNIFVVYATSPDLLYLFEVGCPDGLTTPDSITLLHAVEVTYYHRSTIVSFPGLSESRVVMLGGSKEIKGVVLPHDKAVRPTVVQLGRCSSDWDLRNCCALGISGSLFFDRVNMTYGMVTHEWDLTLPDQSIPLLLPNHQAPRLSHRLLAFDEVTGCLVFLHDTWDHNLLVMDLA